MLYYSFFRSFVLWAKEFVLLPISALIAIESLNRCFELRCFRIQELVHYCFRLVVLVVRLKEIFAHARSSCFEQMFLHCTETRVIIVPLFLLICEDHGQVCVSVILAAVDRIVRVYSHGEEANSHLVCRSGHF